MSLKLNFFARYKCCMAVFDNYSIAPGSWDEMYEQGKVRSPYQLIHDFLRSISKEELNQKEELAKRLFMSQGIMFTVYSSGEGIEKIFPFDIIPRIVTAAELYFVERGIKQKVKSTQSFFEGHLSRPVYYQGQACTS